jgi:hypothetical protein
LDLQDLPIQEVYNDLLKIFQDSDKDEVFWSTLSNLINEKRDIAIKIPLLRLVEIAKTPLSILDRIREFPLKTTKDIIENILKLKVPKSDLWTEILLKMAILEDQVYFKTKFLEIKKLDKELIEFITHSAHRIKNANRLALFILEKTPKKEKEILVKKYDILMECETLENFIEVAKEFQIVLPEKVKDE